MADQHDTAIDPQTRTEFSGVPISIVEIRLAIVQPIAEQMLAKKNVQGKERGRSRFNGSEGRFASGP